MKSFRERYTLDIYKPIAIDPGINTLEYAEITREDGEKVNALLITKENEIELEFFLRHHRITGREKELVLRKIFNIKR